MSKKIINKLVKLGGNHWQKHGKNRVYFNANTLAKILGYKWSTYKTGNISYAEHKGEKISNSEMRRVIDDLRCKLHYDLNDKKFGFYTGIGVGEEHTQKAIKKLRTKI